MRLSEQFIKNAIKQVSILYKVFPEIPTFSIDARTLVPGNIFIAIEGQNFDGHDFVGEAIKKGAAGLIIAETKKSCLSTLEALALKDKCVLLVPDTRIALMELATAWREQFTCPVIGITGSVGKTSTREILCTILRMNNTPFVASEKNQNNALGLALSILKMRPEHQVAIFELGISQRGEMAELVAMAKPTRALITCIGHAHMEGLGSIVDIATEKRAIFSLFKEDNIGVINGDQPLLAHVGYIHPVVKFGYKTTNQVQARKVVVNDSSINFVLKLYGEKYKITLGSNHEGAIYNTLAAVTMAYLLQVPAATIVKAIQEPVAVEGRYEKRTLTHGKGIVINDCYSANPESMKAALLALEHLQTNAKKIAILGDMLELGANTAFWHRQLGRFLRKVPSLNELILVGSNSEWTKQTVPVNVALVHVADWSEALAAIKARLDQESVILVKGSNKVGLSNLVNAISFKDSTNQANDIS